MGKMWNATCIALAIQTTNGLAAEGLTSFDNNCVARDPAQRMSSQGFVQVDRHGTRHRQAPVSQGLC